jgi:hypothetical protein
MSHAAAEWHRLRRDAFVLAEGDAAISFAAEIKIPGNRLRSSRRNSAERGPQISLGRWSLDCIAIHSRAATAEAILFPPP